MYTFKKYCYNVNTLSRGNRMSKNKKKEVSHETYKSKNTLKFTPRDYYETKIGRRISDSLWTRIKRRIVYDLELDLNFDSIQTYIALINYLDGNYSGKTNIYKRVFEERQQMAQRIQTVSFSKTTDNESHIYTLGMDIMTVISEFNMHPHPETRAKWFKDIGGFRKYRQYTTKEVAEILQHIFRYRLRVGYRD